LTNGRRFNASVVRRDAGADLALLSTNENIPALQLALSAGQRQGSQVLALGYPEGLTGQPTLTG
jgi:S1-C subfamily serine protease